MPFPFCVLCVLSRPIFFSKPNQSSAGTILHNSIPPQPQLSATNSSPSCPATCSLPAQPTRRSREPSHQRAHNRARQSRETRRARRLESAASSPRQNLPDKNTRCCQPCIYFCNRNCRFLAALQQSATPHRPKSPPSSRVRRFSPRPKLPNQISTLPPAHLASLPRARQIANRRSNLAAPVSRPAAIANLPAAELFPN